jgi:hypothetical protein
MTGISDSPRRPWWGPQSSTGQPNPVFSVSLFGLANRRLDAAASLLVLVVIVGTRLAAFPASIWEQDEAYFAAAVVDFDVTVNQPHPPWFPLWIFLGKLMHLVVDDPARSLQIVSFLASVWVLFPLTALFALWLRRDLAVAGALAYLFTPAVLVLSCRAFGGPTATAFFVAALAFWLRGQPSLRDAGIGSIGVGLCLLIRPHLLPAVFGVGAYRLLVSRTWRERWAVIAPVSVVVVLGGAGIVMDAGGLAPLRAALVEHGQYHFGSLAGASLEPSDSGLARAFLEPWAAVAWMVLAIIGVGAAISHRTSVPAGAVTAVFGLLPVVIAVGYFSYLGNVRYFVPVVALASGFAVLGAAVLLRGRTLPVVAILCAVTFAAAGPALTEYRRVASPPLRGIERALVEASKRGAVIVSDRTLAAFFAYRRSTGDIPFTVLFDSQIGSETVAPPPWLTVAVFDAGGGSIIAASESEATFDVVHWWLGRLSQGRFLQITVATGAAVGPVSGVPGR